jgi:hypothetical protein
MAFCVFCESRNARVDDACILKPEECDASTQRHLAEHYVNPLAVPCSKYTCPDCGRAYRIIRTPLEETFSKKYLRAGHRITR